VTKIWTAALATACLSLTAVAGEDASLEISGAWVRALPSSQPNTAGYLTLNNRGDTALAVIGANADIAKKVELHTTRQVDGLMRMEPVKGLALAPGETVELAPGGTHLMLLGLTYMPAPGDEVKLCLQLATGADVCTQAEVRGSGSAQDHQHPHQSHE
jgi:copper(I)-binding protein